ncbi:hypothetical protein [Hymenobacter lapidarius]|uniref:hypothetical protein n=1 Tax=Hymenobacter lapidarius TaxID=1908237 RepID=UPI000F780679|nr:hypothetical protein [Hymenobacter lapidarius]
MTCLPSAERYHDLTLTYRRCGRSGLRLPALLLGLWHNFGDVDVRATGRATRWLAFDRGLTHVDLANNYAPRPARPKSTLAACSATILPATATI